MWKTSAGLLSIPVFWPPQPGGLQGLATPADAARASAAPAGQSIKGKLKSSVASGDLSAIALSPVALPVADTF